MTDMRTAIIEAGLTPPDEIIADGQFHRFRVNGDRRRNGWYIVEGERGAAGCWKRGVTVTWRDANARPVSRIEIEREQRRREATRRAKHLRVAELAREAWADAAPCQQHAYLTKKRVRSHGLRSIDNVLLIPMYAPDGQLWSLQRILPSGVKLFLKGGRARGLYFSIGKPRPQIAFAEGYATAASIFAATELPVAVCFSASNMVPVAEALRRKYPTHDFIFAADHDEAGIDYARTAAKKVSGVVVWPPRDGTDFNDLVCAHGPEALRSTLEHKEAS